MHTILGAGGAIATELAFFLNDRKVRLVSRNPAAVTGNEELVSADLLDATAVENAVGGSSCVYLVAGLPYKAKVWEKQWPQIVENVISACTKHKAALIFFDNVYAIDPAFIENITEESPMNPSSRKGMVRQQIVQRIQKAGQENGLKWMIVRAADFYGPAIRNSLLLETVYKKMKNGKRPQWIGNPRCTHSFTFTPDAASGTALLALADDTWNQVWNLPTSSRKLTGEDWIKLFGKELSAPSAYTPVSKGMMKFIGFFSSLMNEFVEMMYQYEKNYFFNSSKFRTRFPEFHVTEPEEAIQSIVAADIFELDPA